MNTKSTKERGRSMIETLGVLAIIAVLTIGGIVGYTYAMNKHHANIILNDVKTLSILSIPSPSLANSPLHSTLTLDQLSAPTNSSYTYVITKQSLDTFYISVTPVSDKVCRMLTEQTPPYAEKVVANALTGGLCEPIENQVFFYLNQELESQDSNPDNLDYCDLSNPCPGLCSECSEGKCIDNNALCAPGKTCIKGECSDCPAGQFDVNGSCISCSSYNPVTVSQQECNKCGNTRIFEVTTHCYACNGFSLVNSTKQECDRCAGAVFMKPSTVVGPVGTCFSKGCGNPDGARSTKAQCEQCPNRYFEGTNDLNGICFGCNGTVSVDGRTCMPKLESCPTGQFFQKGGYCTECASGYSVISTQEECAKCPKDTRFFSQINDNYCNSCRRDVPFSTTKQECGRCSNRYFEGKNDLNGICKVCNGTVSADGRSCS